MANAMAILVLQSAATLLRNLRLKLTLASLALRILTLISILQIITVIG